MTNLHKYTNSKVVKTLSSFHLQLLLAGANQSHSGQLDRSSPSCSLSREYSVFFSIILNLSCVRRLIRIQDVKKRIDFEVDENAFKIKLNVIPYILLRFHFLILESSELGDFVVIVN